MQFKGIDVSQHNGVIDWKKVQNAGVEFAILRAGYGVYDPNQIDKCFERNYSECKRLGIPVGAYHYSYAKNPEGAKKELEFFLEIIKGKTFEYPMCFDIEDRSIENLPRDILTDNVITFCKGLEAKGYYSAVYCSTNWIYNILDRSRLKDIDLWLADWREKPDKSIKKGMWQHSRDGKVDGIKGDVDLDYAYKNYPYIIKSSKLNGFGKTGEKSIIVTAEKICSCSAEADVLSVGLERLGMSVSKKELIL